MPVFGPSIVNIPPPAQIISMDGTPYEEILQSLVNNFYLVENIYIKASNLSQINEPLYITKYDVNGNKLATTMVTALDVNQFQFALNLDAREMKMVLNGQLVINYNLQAGQTVYMIFTTKQFGTQMLLPTDNILTDDEFFENEM